MDRSVWDEMPQKDKDMYIKTFRTLLNSTNIVRDKDENHKAMYNFINSNEKEYRKYLREELEYAGFEMTINTDFKYIHIHDVNDSVAKTNRQNLNLVESITLCCLWLIYIESINTNALRKSVVIELQDFFIKLNVFNITIPQFKTAFDKAFELLKRFNMIDYKGKPTATDERFYITIFPTIQFALDQDELTELLRKKKQEYINYSKKKAVTEDAEEDNEEDDGE